MVNNVRSSVKAHMLQNRANIPSRISKERCIDGFPIRVLVVDDHVMVRHGLCRLLKEHHHIDVIGEAANGEEAVHLAEQLQPDIVLMDVNMPKMDGVQATRLIKACHPRIIVIGLSLNETSQIEATMEEAGATRFLHKEAAVDQLLQTITGMSKYLSWEPIDAS